MIIIDIYPDYRRNILLKSSTSLNDPEYIKLIHYYDFNSSFSNNLNNKTIFLNDLYFSILIDLYPEI